MKQLFVFCAVGLFVPVAQSGEIILESGRNTTGNFNGWFVEPFTLFSSMEFMDDHVDFTSENGGEISIELMKKIPAMADYDELLVEFQIDEVIASRVNSVTVFASRDGLRWDSVPTNAAFKAVRFANPDYSYKFLKAVANVTFFSNGKVRWSYTKVEGFKLPHPISSTDGHTDFIATDAKELFQIYSHSSTINIVSGDELPFTTVITDMTGAIVFL